MCGSLSPSPMTCLAQALISGGRTGRQLIISLPWLLRGAPPLSGACALHLRALSGSLAPSPPDPALSSHRGQRLRGPGMVHMCHLVSGCSSLALTWEIHELVSRTVCSRREKPFYYPLIRKGGHASAGEDQHAKSIHLAGCVALAPAQVLVSGQVSQPGPEAGMLPLWPCGTGLSHFLFLGILEMHVRRDSGLSSQGDSSVAPIGFH